MDKNVSCRLRSYRKDARRDLCDDDGLVDGKRQSDDGAQCQRRADDPRPPWQRRHLLAGDQKLFGEVDGSRIRHALVPPGSGRAHGPHAARLQVQTGQERDTPGPERASRSGCRVPPEHTLRDTSHLGFHSQLDAMEGEFPACHGREPEGKRIGRKMDCVKTKAL